MPCAGNSLSELEESKGHYLCNIRLKPIVQRFKLPEADEPAGSAPADGTSQPAVGSDGPVSYTHLTLPTTPYV